jgi:4-amino-4-deoxy-L-arabinose transferase-like glycosyltransferase
MEERGHTMTPGTRRSIAVGVPALLLLILLFELTSSISWQSPSWDEGDHLFAGYMSLKTRDNSLNPEHPPMAKMVAALPLMPMALKIAPQQGRYFKDEAYLGGRELIYRNQPAYSPDTILFRARMAVSIFTFALALLVFFAGTEMFSLPAGLLAMALFVFEPSIITNGAYVTTDETVACMFFAAVYGFYRYVRRPSAPRLLVAGILAGMCLAAKHSAVLLAPMLILIALGEVIGQSRSWWPAQDKTGQPRKVSILRMTAALAAIAAIAVFVLWTFYSFRYHMRPDGSAMTPSLIANAAALPALQARIILFFARFHLLPESYLYGLIDVLVVGDFTPSYIFGKVYAHGVWFYFPVVLALKWTIGAGCLLALAFWAIVTGKLRRPREVLFLTVPVVVYLAVAISSPLNIGVRHILPVFAFILVLAAGGAWSLVAGSAANSRRWAYAVALLLIAHIVSSVRVFPNYLPYANELWGGPSQTHRYLTDSAVDWGQQLKPVKAYIEQHHIEHCWFAYTVAPFILPSDYGIPCKLLPTLDTFAQMDIDVPQTVDGPVFMSYLAVNGYEFGTSVRNPYQALFLSRPDAVIADGVAVYNGSFQFPTASAMMHVHQTAKLLSNKDVAGALREAQAAATLDPDGFDAVLALGDALRASHRNPEAAAAYSHALQIAAGMEPSARKDWLPQLNERLKSVS